jgi:hypothetical protein
VLVDGRRVATIDLRAATDEPRRVVLTRRLPGSGPHTIRLRHLGPASPGDDGRVEIDAIVTVGR